MESAFLRSATVMTLHKLTAGDGYTYLTRQVAAFDATERGHAGLGRDDERLAHELSDQHRTRPSVPVQPSAGGAGWPKCKTCVGS